VGSAPGILLVTVEVMVEVTVVPGSVIVDCVGVGHTDGSVVVAVNETVTVDVEIGGQVRAVEEIVVD
jgi:hypothetical protein